MSRTTVKLIRTSVEVPDGKGSYRWTNGYYVVDPLTGNRLYPPVVRQEAINLAREIAGADCKIEEVES